MPAFSSAQFTKFLRGISIRQVRLGCGVVLFAYLLSHFLNHALGNISMAALANGVNYHTAFWQFLPVAIVLYGAALIHACLGIWALPMRRHRSPGTSDVTSRVSWAGALLRSFRAKTGAVKRKRKVISIGILGVNLAILEAP